MTTNKQGIARWMVCAMLISGVFIGCDSANVTQNQVSQPDLLTATLKSDLNLSSQQFDDIVATVDDQSFDNPMEKRWEVARKLQSVLTADQKESLFASQSANADQVRARRKSHTEKGQRRDRMRKGVASLDLTEEQRAAVKLNRDENRAALRSAKEDGEVSAEEREQLVALREEQRTTFFEMLSVEQQQKVEAVRAERGERRMERSEPSGEDGARQRRGERTEKQRRRSGDRANSVERFEKVSEELSLSEEQAIGMKEIRETVRQQIKAIRESDDDRENKFEAMQQVKESARTQVGNVLTAEQLELQKIFRSLTRLDTGDRKHSRGNR